MDMISQFFQQHWDRIFPDWGNRPQKITCVFLTPGFQASSHLLAFVLKNEEPRPTWVVKLPRLPGDHARLDREAANLRLIHSKKEGGFDSIPRLAAYEDYHQVRLLVQNMLPGRIMRPDLVRRQAEVCIAAASNWLQEVHRRTRSVAPLQTERLMESEIEFLKNVLNEPGEPELLAKTATLLAPMGEVDIPAVFEHGDFSSPNLLLDDHQCLQVVDWELADPSGLPLADFFFFLTYVCFARARAENLQQQLSAVRETFFAPDGWVRGDLLHYAQQVDVPAAGLSRLFLFTWVRYLANMIRRLSGGQPQISPETAQWLRRNRYYHIWRESVDRLAHFVIPDE